MTTFSHAVDIAVVVVIVECLALGVWGLIDAIRSGR